MKSQFLIKINNFIKNRLIEFLGIVLILISFFLLSSIITYSPSDPNFIYSPESTEIKNIGGFYGSVVSDFLLSSIGLISILLVVNFFWWGIKVILEKKINNFLTKIIYSLVYIIFGSIVLNSAYNDSFWLIDNGNGGFVGRIIRESIYYFSPVVGNQYIIYSFALFTIIFFILSLGIKTSEFIKIISFPFFAIKKILKFLNKDDITSKTNKDDPSIYFEKENLENEIKDEKQPILPFSQNKEVKNNVI